MNADANKKRAPVLNADELAAFVKEVFPQADNYRWQIEALGPEEITIRLPIGAEHLRPGGTVSGPTMFALADITSYLLILAHIGKVELAVTTSLNINFLNKPGPTDLIAEGSFLKLGKRLAICDVHIKSEGSDKIVAQATATYSIPPRAT